MLTTFNRQFEEAQVMIQTERSEPNKPFSIRMSIKVILLIEMDNSKLNDHKRINQFQRQYAVRL